MNPMHRATLALLAIALRGQDGYEIQVYASPTVSPKATMVELHSNFVFQGVKDHVDGVYPTEHTWHETVEITHGWTNWFETGFYIFTAAGKEFGWQYVGSHFRPRFRVPPSWRWPVGVSISQEIGWASRKFTTNPWNYELRPIVDKQLGRWYLGFNPVLEKSLHGEDARRGWLFSPNVKVSATTVSKVALGFEYYGNLGPLTGFDPFKNQEQQIIPTVDLNFGPKWEFNFGVGVGITGSTEHVVAKLILGYRFGL